MWLHLPVPIYVDNDDESWAAVCRSTAAITLPKIALGKARMVDNRPRDVEDVNVYNSSLAHKIIISSSALRECTTGRTVIHAYREL